MNTTTAPRPAGPDALRTTLLSVHRQAGLFVMVARVGATDGAIQPGLWRTSATGWPRGCIAWPWRPTWPCN